MFFCSAVIVDVQVYYTENLISAPSMNDESGDLDDSVKTMSLWVTRSPQNSAQHKDDYHDNRI